GAGQGHRAGAVDGIRDRQAERRLRLGLQRGGAGDHIQGLPAPGAGRRRAGIAAPHGRARRRARGRLGDPPARRRRRLRARAVARAAGVGRLPRAGGVASGRGGRDREVAPGADRPARHRRRDAGDDRARAGPPAGGPAAGAAPALPLRIHGGSRARQRTRQRRRPFPPEAVHDGRPGGEGARGAGRTGADRPIAMTSVPESLRGAHILVVEDDPRMRHTLEMLLSQDWRIEAVGDGLAAVAAAVRQVPDLVLCDLLLPGLDGFGVLHHLRADPRTSLVPVIAVSGLDQEEDRIRALEAGAADFLIKPFSERELRARVTTQLEMTRLRREALERHSEARFRVLVEAIKDYAICLLDSEGRIVSWSAGAEAIHGYAAEEILGRPFSLFHLREPGSTPEQALRQAATEGRFEDEGWRLRRDGSRFWANTVITPIHDQGRPL